MIPLLQGPAFEPVVLAQRLQDRLDGFGAAGAQVAVEAAGAAQGGLEPDLLVLDPSSPLLSGSAEAAPHLLGQPGEVSQSACRRRRQQDLVGVVAGVLRQLIGPVEDPPGP